MSLALYRKYRPGTFAEVIGQEHVTAPLMQAIRSGRVHHAYLFSGPRGCGKTSSARILARSLNCAQGPTPEPCGTCDSCRALEPNGPGSLDVIEIDAASHGLVDDARDLRERAFFAPVSSRFKVYIIDEAHMVTAAAFNALLKVVEEPPPHIRFVFATTEPDKVIGTIRSRTHHYPFRLVPPREMLGHLIAICAREGVEVDPPVLHLVVRAGAGSVRDALSVLDQLLAGAGPEGLTYARAQALLGFTDAALLDDVVDAFAAGDAAAVYQAVDRVVEGGHDPRRFAADLLERFRDLLILEAVSDAADKHLLDAPDDAVERMRTQAARFGRAELSRAGDILNAGLTEMRGATAPRLLLELICARVLLPAAASDERSVLARLERLERRLEIADGGSGAGAAAPRSAGRAPQPAGLAPQPAGRAPQSAVGRGQAEAVPASLAAGSAPVASAAGSAPVASAAGAAPAASAGADRTVASATGGPTAGAAAEGGSATAPANAPAWPAATVPADGGPPAEAPAAVAVTAPAVVPAESTAAALGAAGDSALTGRAGAEAAGGLDAAAVRRVWPEVLDTVKLRRRTVHALLLDAQVVDVAGRTLTLSFAVDALARRFSDPLNSDVLVEALRAVLGVDWRVEALAGTAGSRPAPTGPRSSETAAAVRPAPAASTYDGFAPGDDPLDDDGAGEPGAALPPGQAAVALLQEGLGAKVIGEIDAG